MFSTPTVIAYSLNISQISPSLLMDSNFIKPTVASHAHPETMDFLSSAWCNFAVQALQPADLQDQSLVLVQNAVINFDHGDMMTKPSGFPSMKMDDTDAKSIPAWKANDVKSWIWMQQAMHPELNYNSCFRKKWLPWKMVPFKSVSIKKWFKELKQKRKEDERLQRAEVHAAISVAGVAAALAAVAAEKKDESSTRDAAVASAAALVAAQCAQMAESMGAKRKELHCAIGSAITATHTTDILTLTAAASTSLKGAATLKARKGYKKRLSGIEPVLPIEDNAAADIDFNFEKCISVLAMGAQLGVQTPYGKYKHRHVSVILNREAKVILKTRSLNLLKTKKKCEVTEVHAELYNDPEGDEGTCYMIALTTKSNGGNGTIKLDMEDDYHLYNTWATTINHMLMHSTSLSKYQLQFYNN